MGRSIKAWPSNRDKCWYVRLGPPSPKTGLPTAVMLRDEEGRKIRLDDEAGKAKALGRLLTERDEREKREMGLTVAEVIDRFIQYHRDHDSAPRTIQEHVARLTRFGNFATSGQPYRNRPAASLTLRDLSAFRRMLTENGNQTGDLKNYYASILACWRWAHRPVEDREPERLIPFNPFDGVKRPPRGKQLKRYISPDMANQLIEFATARIATVHEAARRLEPRRVLTFKLIALSGARPFEATGLEWREIDWEERMIVIKPRPEGRAKTRKGRHLAIPDEVYDELAAIRDDPENDPEWAMVLRSKFRKDRPEARRMGVWFRELRRDAIAAGILVDPKATLYYFRHAWQTIGLRVAKAEQLATAAGNSVGILLSTYDQTQNSEIREVAGLIAEVRRAEVAKAKAAKEAKKEHDV